MSDLAIGMFAEICLLPNGFYVYGWFSEKTAKNEVKLNQELGLYSRYFEIKSKEDLNHIKKIGNP